MAETFTPVRPRSRYGTSPFFSTGCDHEGAATLTAAVLAIVIRRKPRRVNPPAFVEVSSPSLRNPLILFTNNAKSIKTPLENHPLGPQFSQMVYYQLIFRSRRTEKRDRRGPTANPSSEAIAQIRQ